MSNVGEEKYKEILGMFNRISQEAFNTMEYYYIWKALLFSRSTKIVGKKKAEKNANLMNLQKHFFILTEHSLLHAFIIGINKFFDRNNVGVSALIKKIQRYEKYFTPELIKQVYPERFMKDDKIYTSYKPIIRRDISEVEGWQNRYQDILSRLKTIRDNQSAHTGFKAVDDITFKPKEIEKLIKAIEIIFNKLQYRFCRTTTSWRTLKRDVDRDVKFLMDNLNRGEEQRLLEIKKKWG